MHDVLKHFLAMFENRRVLLLSILGMLFLVFISVGYLVNWREANITVLLGFFVSTLATMFSIGIGADLLQKRLDVASRRLVFGPLIDFWMAGKNSHFRIYIEVLYDKGRRFVGFDTMSALSELTVALTSIHGDSLHYEVIDANTLTSYADLEHLDCNVILLGGDRSIPLTIDILRRNNSRYKQECTTSPRRIIRLAETPTDQVYYESVFSINGIEQKFMKEYALVTRIPVDRGKSNWYLISGNHGVGTYLASLAISDPKKCPAFPHDLKSPIQIVFIGENIIRSSLPSHKIDITSQRGWELLSKENL